MKNKQATETRMFAQVRKGVDPLGLGMDCSLAVLYMGEDRGWVNQAVPDGPVIAIVCGPGFTREYLRLPDSAWRKAAVARYLSPYPSHRPRLGKNSFKFRIVFIFIIGYACSINVLEWTTEADREGLSFA